MKNGSLEFVVCIVEKFKGYLIPYTRYEYIEEYEDYGYASKINSKRNNKKNTYFM